MTRVNQWAVRRFVGDAQSLHDRPLPEPLSREIWIHSVERAAIVLASAQRDDVVDRAALASRRLDVARRRSGGGAVLIVPDETLWIDVLVGAGDPLWSDDVARAFHWLGEVWAAAISAISIDGPVVHRGPMRHGEWSSLVCFAGIGAGEVIVGGRKAVGISQRRTRAGARFQCVAYSRWDAATLSAVLSAHPPPAVLDTFATVIADLGALERAFLAAVNQR